MVAEAPPPFPLPRLPLSSLRSPIFFSFCPNSEPGPRLYDPELVSSLCVSQCLGYSNNWANQSILLKMTDSEKQPKLCRIYLFIISILKSLVIPVIWLALGRVIRKYWYWPLTAEFCDFKMAVIKWYLNFLSCTFGLKSYLWFQIELALRACPILKSRLWFQTKLYSTQFSHHY